MSRHKTLLICTALLLPVLSGLAGVQAGVKLTLHWDRGAGPSKAMVTDSSDEILAAHSWSGALPREYLADTGEMEVPTIALGQLRDQLEQSLAPEATDALVFVRELMGALADIPVRELPPILGTWLRCSRYRISEWCGVSVTSEGECVADHQPGMVDSFCSGHACKGTEIRPQE
jgi:hypothetical protein